MNFPLTAHWFNKIESGEKTHEYRARTPYWTKRINKLNKGDFITVSYGYSKRRIEVQIIDIQFISLTRLETEDNEAYEFLKDKCHSFWDIEFKHLAG